MEVSYLAKGRLTGDAGVSISRQDFNLTVSLRSFLIASLGTTAKTYPLKYIEVIESVGASSGKLLVLDRRIQAGRCSEFSY